MNYKKAIEIKPDFIEAYFNLGKILFKLNKLSEAEINYKKLIDLKSDIPEAYKNLGMILIKLKKLDEAEKNYKKCIELKPDYADALNELGILYKKRGKMNSAISSFYKVLDLKPDYLRTRYHLASSLENEAKIHYHEAFKKYTLKDKTLDANLYTNKIAKKNISVDKDITSQLNDLSKNINDLYGTYYKVGDKRKYYSINSGPCGIFANQFYMLWNSRFLNQVKIAFIILKDNNECSHTLIQLPNMYLFDGGVGVHKPNIYDYSRFKLSVMEEYNLETLDKNTWGLGMTNYEFCPNFSLKKTFALIEKNLDEIYSIIK